MPVYVCVHLCMLESRKNRSNFKRGLFYEYFNPTESNMHRTESNSCKQFASTTRSSKDLVDKRENLRCVAFPRCFNSSEIFKVEEIGNTVMCYSIM